MKIISAITVQESPPIVLFPIGSARCQLLYWLNQSNESLYSMNVEVCKVFTTQRTANSTGADATLQQYLPRLIHLSCSMRSLARSPLLVYLTIEFYYSFTIIVVTAVQIYYDVTPLCL